VSTFVKVLVLFGTRPEVIKLAPVIRALERTAGGFETIHILSGQHADLVRPFLRSFAVRVDRNLGVMEPGQTPSRVVSRVLAALDPVLKAEAPDAVLVQGDTSTALAGALAAFHRGIPVGHVEAGLRSGDLTSPFPEEMNRRLISRLATWHFAATERNRLALLREGTDDARVFVTGNPVVDAVRSVLDRLAPGPMLAPTLAATTGLRRIALTTHRRESFGPVMRDHLRTLRSFVERRSDVALILPVHPNPAVLGEARAVLGGHPRIHLLEPLGYEDFIALLAESWLVVSDSGGVQEEAPSLGRAVLVLRRNTERPEAVEAGVARLVGGPQRLQGMLEEAAQPGSWVESVTRSANPFGCGDAGERIAVVLQDVLGEWPRPHAGRKARVTP
jgi:UDP-N-acetylglucosamine 2-epimerase (non-hydrolysing)